MKPRAFTLAEVLISLALLGVIAMFTLPKLVTSQGTVKNRSLLIETVASLQSVIYEGNLTGDLYTKSSLSAYLGERLNATQICTSNFQTEGCYSLTPPANAQNGGGIVLPNGVVITDISTNSMSACVNAPSSNLCGDGWFIDLNGKDGPNTFGTDKVSVITRWGGVNGNDSHGTFRRVSEVWADVTDPASIALWDAAFK